jgi:type III restriction enzyme
VRVFDIGERRIIRPADLRDAACIIVATMQAFRVANTGDRNVYADDEALEPHFAGLGALPSGLEPNQDGPRKGQVAYSFANLMHLHRPVMIVDEAHNFVTPTSAAVRERLSPSVVIEFTATPREASNVIVNVSAAELRAAEMIKLPIMLTEHSSWEQAVNGAVTTRERLAREAAGDGGRYLRPIALYQAQPAAEGAVATVDVLKAHLIDSERVPPERIAIATGDVRGLEGIDLFDPTCPIEHVITVQALREGWDCSFAYVFCSVASQHGAAAVEQLLGRVLRQPYATRRATESLNRAYAHVSERSFAAAAEALKDRLVAMGFDTGEAADVIEPGEALPLAGGGYAEPAPFVLELREAPSIDGLSEAVKRVVRIEPTGDGGARITVAATASAEAVAEFRRAMEATPRSGTDALGELDAWAARRKLAPAQAGVPFAPVPRLMVRVQGELELATAETLIDLAGWDLLSHPARLEPAEFDFEEAARTFRFDLDGELLTYGIEAHQAELALDYAAAWDEAALARWLDRTVPHAHTGQAAFLEYSRRVVRDLIDRRGMALPVLLRGKYALRRALEAKVARLREATAARGRDMLFADDALPVVEPAHAFRFDPNVYPAAATYEGPMRFEKHYYRRPGAMNGEEAECAMAIDSLPAVKHWVRNLERRPEAFSLPTSTDRFYPDFVAELADGGLFVVEYKGADRLSNDDTREKDNIGRRWAERSGGRCRFLTASKRPGAAALREQLLSALA